MSESSRYFLLPISLLTFTVVSVLLNISYCSGYRIIDFNLHLPDNVEHFSYAYLNVYIFHVLSHFKVRLSSYCGYSMNSDTSPLNGYMCCDFFFFVDYGLSTFLLGSSDEQKFYFYKVHIINFFILWF